MPHTDNVRKDVACVNCGDRLGDKEPPFFVTDDAGDGLGKQEAWCPQCFVWHRVNLEPKRFHPPSYMSVRCARCGITSVDSGHHTCLHCKSRDLVALPPKPHAGMAAG